MSLSGSFTTGGGPGVNIADLVMLISDDDKFKSRLKELSDIEAKAKEVVDVVGPASEIIQLRDAAGKDRDEAGKLLSDAIAKAEAIKEAAGIEAQSIVSAAEVQASLIKDGAASVVSEAEAKLAEAEKTKTSTIDRELFLIKETERLQADHENATASLKVAKDAAEAEFAKFKAANEKFISIKAEVESALNIAVAKMDEASK